jgi:hypothetical protein
MSSGFSRFITILNLLYLLKNRKKKYRCTGEASVEQEKKPIKKNKALCVFVCTARFFYLLVK